MQNNIKSQITQSAEVESVKTQVQVDKDLLGKQTQQKRKNDKPKEKVKSSENNSSQQVKKVKQGKFRLKRGEEG